MRHAAFASLICLPLLAASSMILRDQFPGSALDPAWKANKGKWEVVGGAVKGAELDADKHAAVIRRAVKYHNANIEFEFKLDGATWLALSLNKQGAHVSRVIIAPSGFRVKCDTPNVELAKSDSPVATGEWHKMRVTVDGRKMTAVLDGKVTVTGEHDGIDVDKVDIGFPVKGSSAWLRNVTVTAR